MMNAIRPEAKLIIVPDAGSNEYDAHKELASKGVDILILDHHEADYYSPDACVINNQLDPVATKSLSGVGVVWKFCSYLDSLLNSVCADSYLDLLAAGCIGDMMDLSDYETRHLVKKGMETPYNPFIKALMEENEYSLKGELTPVGISFYIAPYVNAVVRSGSQADKKLVFEAMLAHKAYEMIPSTKRGCSGQQEQRVIQAVRTCGNLRNRQNKAKDAKVEAIEQMITDNSLLESKILAVRLPKDASAETTLTGLIGNVLTAKFQRPVLILNETYDEEKNLVWAGSGRAPADMKIENFREFLLDTGYPTLAQGHGAAFGFAIPDDRFEAFMQRTDELLANEDFSPCYKVDYIFNGSDFKAGDILELASLKSVWGKGVEEPAIAIEHINLHSGNVQLMSRDKNPTLKITLSNGVSLIKFKSSEEEFEQFNSQTGCITINVVGKCEKNEWMGRVTPQILVTDFEVIGSQKYYF